MFKKFIVFSVVCLISMSVLSIAFAEKQEWVEKTYDFSKVRRVTFFPPNPADKLMNGINENQIEEIYLNKIKLPTHVQHVRLGVIIEGIKADTGIDLDAIGAKDPSEAIKLLVQNGSKYVDLIVFSTVFEYSIGSQYFEGYTYNTTSYQTSTVYGYGGSATIQTPVTITNSVPGGNRPVAYASVRFDVVDLQKGKNVITRLDDRARVATLSNTKPQDLYGRIIDAFMDDLSEKLQKSK